MTDNKCNVASGPGGDTNDIGLSESIPDLVAVCKNVLEAAKLYIHLGYAVIFCYPDKQPKHKWKTEAITDCERVESVHQDGDLVAIVVPVGVLVLDADTLDTDTTSGDSPLARVERLWGSLGLKFNLYEYVIANTGGGGLHIFFKLPEGVLVGNKTGDLPQGFDVRSGGKGYVIAAPSLHESGRQYEWHPEGDPLCCPDELPTIPEQLLDLIKKKPAAPSVPSKSRTIITPEKAKILLDRLDVTKLNYDQWVRSGMAISTITGGAGGAIWNDFSDGDPRFAGEDRQAKWASFEKYDGPRLGFTCLFNLIRSQGGKVPKGIFREKIVMGVRLGELAEHGIEALGAVENVYQRGGALCRTIQVRNLGGETDYRVDDPERLTIRPIKSATLKAELSGAADWVRLKTNKDGKTTESAAIPNDDVVRTILEAGEYPGIRCLVGTATGPFVRADGTICDTSGYDEATGILVNLNDEFPLIPEYPTQADAAALARINDVVCDFPLNENSKAVFPAIVLTLLGRNMIAGSIPVVAIDASAAGSGKTLFADAASILATGLPCPKSTWCTSSPELQKTLLTFAMDPAPAILFDNMSGAALRGAALEKAVTSGIIRDRILGSNDAPTLPWRSLILATDNNIRVMGDMRRRTISARVIPTCERPEDRTEFKHPRLLEWVRKNRPSLVVDALTILRGWHVAGQPKQPDRTWGSFESWAEVIGGAIHWAGGGDIHKARFDFGVDEDRNQDAIVLEQIAELFPDKQDFTAEGLIAARSEATTDTDAIASVIPLTGAAGFASWLRRNMERVIGGRRLVRTPKTTGGRAHWAVESV